MIFAFVQICVSGEPSAVCVPDAPPAQPENPAANAAAGSGEHGLQERAQRRDAASRRPQTLHLLPGPPAEERRGVTPHEAHSPA